MAISEQSDVVVASEDSDLARGLRNRHVQMIALGGAIGVGLFLGSGRAIHQTGPALLLAYIPAGIAVFFILRALGEMALYRPVSGSFASYAREFIGPATGFFTGWTYWLAWIATCVAELTAMGVYVQYWAPGVPGWVTCLVILLVLFGANLLSVRVFGEAEFWFALIKVIAIVGIVVGGIAIVAVGFGNLGQHASFKHLYDHGGFLPNGVFPVLLSLQAVMFAFFGMELIGVTAGEARNPEKTLPRAINSVAIRLFLFYFCALGVLMSLIPWDEIDPDISPFTFVFRDLGLPAAATIINLVVFTAALSSSNSGLFSTGRMLHSLAHAGHAPRWLVRVNKHHVPVAGVFASSFLLLGGVALNYAFPRETFAYVTALATLGGLWTWGVICVCHLRYRRAANAGSVSRSKFRMPFSPWSNFYVFGFLLLVAVLLAFQPETRLSLYVAPAWIVVVGVGYVYTRRKAAAAVVTAAAPNEPASSTAGVEPARELAS